MGNVIFDGHDLRDYGIGLSGGGTWAAPSRNVTKATIPGRHGELIIDEGEFANVSITYPAWIARGFEHKFEKFQRMMANHTDKYYRLEDTYHPDYYRMARAEGGIIPEAGTLNRSGKFDIVFDCRPEKWIKSAAIPFTISGTVEIFNPTPYEAKPLITLSRSTRMSIQNSNGTSALNYSAHMAAVYDAEVDELMINDTYANEYGRRSGAISLMPGNNVIKTNAEIEFTPRFYVI